MNSASDPELPPGWYERGWRIRRFGNVSCFVFDGTENIKAVEHYYRNMFPTVLESIIDWFKGRLSNA